MPSPRVLGIVIACASLLAHAPAFARPSRGRRFTRDARNVASTPVSSLAAHGDRARSQDGRAAAALLLERAGGYRRKRLRPRKRAPRARSVGARHLPQRPRLFYVLPAASSTEPETFRVRAIDEATGANAVSVAGGTIVRQKGDLAIVRAPIARSRVSLRSPTSGRWRCPRAGRARSTSSRVRSKVSQVQAAGGLPQAYDGAGVAVGVLDSGPTTRTPTSARRAISRVRALLDYSIGTDGATCRPGQLDSLTCPEIDGSGGHGHGTHVTGIAAGGGRRNAAFKGMAPAADILFVKGIRDAQSNGGFGRRRRERNGVHARRGRVAGKPAVVNLSLGGQSARTTAPRCRSSSRSLRRTGPHHQMPPRATKASTPFMADTRCRARPSTTRAETGTFLAGPRAYVDIWAPSTSNISFGLRRTIRATSRRRCTSTAAAPGQLLQARR